MKHIFTLSIVFLTTFSASAQSTIMAANQEIKTAYESFVFDVDDNDFRTTLATAPMEDLASKSEALTIDLPLPDGSFSQVKVLESPIMEEALSAKYPDIKTYKVFGDNISGRIGYTYKGFHGILFTENGTVYIDPVGQSSGTYHSYSRKSYMDFYSGTKEFQCLAEDEAHEMHSLMNERGGRSGEQMRTYRLALACTGEYAQFHGGTVNGALSAMVVSMNRINGVYEREFSITMILIGNNDLLIFLNPATDPYTNNSGSQMLGQNQSTVTSIIGSSNYDIGHVFSTGGGGVAFYQSVCSNNKARGVTGSGSPIGDPFDIDYVAHEMGHQFGGSHTFNATTGSCGGGNRAGGTAFEPGSGATIMAYAGICGSGDNIQSNSDDYFHAGSFDEIIFYSQNSTGNNCAVITNTGNTAPTVTVPAGGFFIPKETPFVLRGSATDAEDASLTYCWEEMDLGPAGSVGAATGTAPIFRSWPAVNNGERTFPRLVNVVAGNTALGEDYATYTREMNFRLSVRDNNPAGGGQDFDELSFDVDGNKGPFVVTSPTTSAQIEAGTYFTVTWDVAQTDQAPINCQSVHIMFCTNNGLIISDTLATAVPNTGSYTVQMPASTGAGRRIRVEAADNIFFNINPGIFQIVSPTAIEGATINLNLTPDFTNSLLDLTWNDDIPNESNWHVERSDYTTGNFSLIATLPGNTTSYSDASVSMNGTPYFYRVYASNGAGNSAFSNEATYSGVGISEVTASNIKVYPNPASGVLFLQLDNGIIASEAKIFNSQSQLIKSFNLKSNTDQLNISDLASGFYFLSVQTDKGAVTIPFQAID